MLGDYFRPWGVAKWIFPKLPVNDWLVIGSISTEDRCLSILHHLSPGKEYAQARFLDIDDNDPSYELADQCRAKRYVNLVRFKTLVGDVGVVSDFKLQDSPLKIKRYLSTVIGEGFKNIVLDISSLPKRFFFPMLRLLSKEQRLENLVVVYSTPEKYFDGALASEPQSWSYLPLFQREEAPPASKCTRVIVGVGFMPFRLPELLKNDYQDQGIEITLILPFPPGPPQFQRNWQFIHEIESTCPLKQDRQIVRVDAYDVAGCFNRLTGLTRSGEERTAFAPFGPKSHSLAMCLFAAKHDCDVYYTQPAHYHPDYSTGTRIYDGKPVTHAYAVKLDGRWLY